MKKHLLFVFVVISFFNVKGQNNFPYEIILEPFSIADLPGIHSYAWGTYEGKHIFIGGRRDGIHARQPFAAFPATQNNTEIFVVDIESETVWSKSVTSLPIALSEQLQATNFEYYQDEDKLIVVGGYGYSTSNADHITHPYLTQIDLGLLTAQITAGNMTDAAFSQIENEELAVTGGNLGKIGNTYYLVGGHRFDGRYNPHDGPSFIQEYTDAIKKFTLQDENGILTINDYSAIPDPLNLHRRDYNLLPQLFPDGTFGYTLFSGVFQIAEDLPFLFPVNITEGGHTPVTDFNQYLSNYHSARIAMHDTNTNTAHNIFFGGISRYYYDGETMIQDDDVPFVKTISRVSRAADGTLEEVKLTSEMPSYLGAGAEFLPISQLAEVAPEVYDINAFSGDSTLLGYIFGGIQSEILNPFANNNPAATQAHGSLFKVYLKPISTTTSLPEETLPGYHSFSVASMPNPVEGQIFKLKATTPEGGVLDLVITDVTGQKIYNFRVAGLTEGENTLEVELSKASLPNETFFILATMNGRLFARTRVILNN